MIYVSNTQASLDLYTEAFGLTVALAHAVAAGATPIAEPVSKPWGQDSSYVADLDGNLIELASRVQG